MKYLLIILITISSFSCKSQIKNEDDTSKLLNIKELTIEESTIINQFLSNELKKNKYKNYKDYNYLLVKEATSKLSSLSIYRYCYEERNLKIRSSTNKDWIIDSLEIKNIQDTLKEKKHLWKSTDITNIKVDTISVNKINESRKNSKEYEKYNNNLIIYLSVPLIFKKEYALIHFICLESWYGYSTIDVFTALLKKSENEKWEIDSYYYDPNFSW